MSSPPLPSDGSSLPEWPSPARRVARTVTSARSRMPGLRTAASTAARPARAVAFWGAIALPFLNLGLLLRGLTTPSETFAFLALLAVNVLALLVGHPHRGE